MNEEILVIKTTLEACFTVQSAATSAWHDTEPVEPVCTDEPTVENLRNLVLLEHLCNFQLWHTEDRCRRTDVPDAVIVECKRLCDAMNQKRSDCIEAIDNCLYALLKPHLPQTTRPRHNTETPGMAVDRLSVLALRVYHMEEQTRRIDAGSDHVKSCREKLELLRRQRADLAKAVLELIADYANGVKVPVLYKQYKMYNDPNLNPELYSKES